MKVVFDANVVIAGCGWRGAAYACLVAMARRRLVAYATTWTVDEARRTAQRLRRTGELGAHAQPMLSWYLSAVRMVEPAPLGRRRSRDARDDPYLACALAARANAVVTFDGDLLDLGKPFGVSMWTPRDLLDALN